MAARARASDAEIIAAYERTNSVWRAGDLLGICGQSVHERLVRLGRMKPLRVFSSEEADILHQHYAAAADAGRLDALAAAMARTKSFICRKARDLGLTDKARTRAYLSEVIAARMRAWHAVHDHPRGMLGKKHSAAARAAMASVHASRWESMSDDERALLIVKQLKGKAAKNGGMVAPIEGRGGGSWQQGWREIGGKRIFFRSAWEANYARYLELMRQEGQIKAWEHEPRTFWFEGIRRGSVSYLPDFRVIATDDSETWHEVKGWMDARSKTKLARMARQFPEIAMVVVDRERYRLFRAIYRYVIDGWEEPPRRSAKKAEAA